MSRASTIVLMVLGLVGVSISPAHAHPPTPRLQESAPTPVKLNSRPLGGAGLVSVSGPSVSYDGRWVTYVAKDASGDGIKRGYIVDRANSTTKALPSDAVNDVWAVTISADGSTIAALAVTDEGPQLQIIDRESLTTDVVASGDGAPLRVGNYRPSLSYDGQSVLFATTDPSMDADTYLQSAVYDRDARRTRLVSVNNQQLRASWYAYPTRLSPNGRYAFFTSDSPNLPNSLSRSSGFNIYRRDLYLSRTTKVPLATRDVLSELSPDTQSTVGLGTDVLYITPVVGGQPRTVPLPTGLTPWCQEFAAHAYMNNAGTKFLIEACQETPYATGVLWSYDAATKIAARITGPTVSEVSTTPDLHSVVYNVFGETSDVANPDGYAVDLSTAPTGTTYVALGDSFSSGEGAALDNAYIGGTDDTGINTCHRSRAAYPERLADTLGYLYEFHACSGALIADFHRGFDQNHNGNTSETASQLSWLNQRTRLVTLSIGGNDLKFGDVLSYCAQKHDKKVTCRTKWEAEVDKARRRIARASGSGIAKNNLPDLYATIRSRAPKAQIFIVGYPRFFPTDPPDTCTTHAPQGKFTKADMRWMNDEIKALDMVVKKAASNAGFAYVDELSAFAGHEICNGNTTEWMNRAVWYSGPRQESFHPNVDGQAALARRVTRAAL